jgi:hypothetical protein
MEMFTAGSREPPGGRSGKTLGIGGRLKVRPETNGVTISPKRPVSPATPTAATIAAAAAARKGPMNGIGANIAARASPSAANIPAVTAPNCNWGTLMMTIETIQLFPESAAMALKSVENMTVSLNPKGTVIVGQLTHIFGVQIPNTHICGRQKLGKKSLRSNEKLKLTEYDAEQLSMSIFGGLRLTLPPENETLAE